MTNIEIQNRLNQVATENATLDSFKNVSKQRLLKQVFLWLTVNQLAYDRDKRRQVATVTNQAIDYFGIELDGLKTWEKQKLQHC